MANRVIRPAGGGQRLKARRTVRKMFGIDMSRAWRVRAVEIQKLG